MATDFIRQIGTEATTYNEDDYIHINGVTGLSRKMLLSNLSDAQGMLQATGAKIVSPSLYFNGSSSFGEIADSSKLSFTDGTDDLPFSLAGWVNMKDASLFVITSKYGSANSTREWSFYFGGDDKLVLLVQDTSGNAAYITADTASTSKEGDWVHVAATYGGAGPNSGTGFSSAMSGGNAVLYINGKAVNATATDNASYTGMSDTAAAARIGRGDTPYSEGEFGSVQIFNRELSSTEIDKLAKEGQLGFADQWGGATATSGTLVIGKHYRLRDFIAGDDFTNVGAGSNADLVEFVATGTTPTTWTNSSVVEDLGAVADFRAEQYSEDNLNLYDLSSNAFVAAGTDITLVGRDKSVSTKEVNAMGAIYLTATAATTPGGAGTYLKALGTTTLNNSESEVHLFDMPANNRLRYTGKSKIHAHIAVSVSMTAASNNKDTSWRVYHYDDSASSGTTLVHSTVQRKIGTGADIGSTALYADCILEENDYVELWFANDTDTTNITVENLYLSAMGVKTLT